MQRGKQTSLTLHLQVRGHFIDRSLPKRERNRLLGKRMREMAADNLQGYLDLREMGMRYKYGNGVGSAAAKLCTWD